MKKYKSSKVIKEVCSTTESRALVSWHPVSCTDHAPSLGNKHWDPLFVPQPENPHFTVGFFFFSAFLSVIIQIKFAIP